VSWRAHRHASPGSCCRTLLRALLFAWRGRQPRKHVRAIRCVLAGEAIPARGGMRTHAHARCGRREPPAGELRRLVPAIKQHRLACTAPPADRVVEELEKPSPTPNFISAAGPAPAPPILADSRAQKLHLCGHDIEGVSIAGMVGARLRAAMAPGAAPASAAVPSPAGPCCLLPPAAGSPHPPPPCPHPAGDVHHPAACQGGL
jgi:hypothetical protein